jgi:AcrR family transcriptional regulator
MRPTTRAEHGQAPTLAARAVRRRVVGAEETAQSDVRALMEAGLALMIKSGGSRQPRVADIVASAGLSNEAFYRYFASKAALVEAIVEQGARTVTGYVRHRMETVSDPAEQLRAGVAAIMKQASDAALATETRAVLGNSMSLSADTPVSVAFVDSLTELFTVPAAALGATDPVRSARTIASAAIGTMQYHLFKGEVPGRDALDHLVAYLLAGLEADRCS